LSTKLINLDAALYLFAKHEMYLSFAAFGARLRLWLRNSRYRTVVLIIQTKTKKNETRKITSSLYDCDAMHTNLFEQKNGIKLLQIT